MTIRLRLTALCAVATLAVLGAASANAASQSLGFNNARQMVPTGPGTFALVWVDGQSLVVGERRFGAAAFSSQATVVSGVRISQPAIARRGDTLVVAWVEGSRIKARVRESGRWLATETLGDGAAPSLAATRDAFGLVWHREGRGSAVLFSRLEGSAGWSAPRALASGDGDDTVSFASIGGSGDRFVAAWKRGGGGAGWEVEVARSDDSGRHWSAARPLGEGADPAVCLADEREVWIAHQTTGRVVVARSTDGGRSFARTDVGAGWFAHLSCSSGGATVAWERTEYPPRHPDPSVKSFGLARVDSHLRFEPEPSPAEANVVAPTVLAAGGHRAYAWIDVAGSSSALGGTLRVVSPG